jgi:site-specific DNA recombinase
MTKAGRWLRVSGDSQDAENQEARVDAYIGARGYEVTRTYRAHDKSATKREHWPLLAEAIADMRAGIIETLVFRNTDRIDRTEELGVILRLVKEAGGRLESVDEPWLADVSGLGGKVLVGVAEFMNSEYSRKLAANVKDAQARRRALGSYAAGDPPYGLEILGMHADGAEHPKPGNCLSCYPDRGGRKTLVPGENAEVVRRIFREAADGSPLARIAKGLSADGVPAPGGGVWPERTVGKVIANPVYRGLVQYQGRTYMTIEPLVTSSDWLKSNQAVKARLRGPGRSGGRPLGALLRPVCGVCGGPMYRYAKSYRCAGVGPNGNSTQRRGCGNTIPVEQLDAEVTADFEAVDDQEVIETVTPGKDYAEEIAATQLAIKDLDVMADDYDLRHAVLLTELRRLRSLPAEPPGYWAEPTGRTEGDAFAEMDFAERQAHIRRWTLTVYAQGTEPRWKLTWIRQEPRATNNGSPYNRPPAPGLRVQMPPVEGD